MRTASFVLAGWLAAAASVLAAPASKGPVVPDDPAPPAKAAPAPGKDGGTWSHAFSACPAEVSARLCAVRLRQSRRAEARDALYLATPTAARASTSTTRGPSRAIAGGRDDLHVRDARGAVGRRAANDVRPLAEEMLVAPDSRRSRSGSIRRRASTTAIRCRRPTSSTRFDMVASKEAAPAVAGRVRRRSRPSTVLDDRTIRFDLKERSDDAHLQRRHACRSSRASGAGPGRQAEDVRRGRHRVPDHDRTVHDRRRDSRPPASTSCATPTTGRATSACAAATTTSTASSTATTATSAVGDARRSRPASSTSTRSIVGAQLGAPAPGPEVGRRPHHEGAVRERRSAGASSRTCSTRGGRCFRPSRAPGDRPHLRLRDGERLPPVQAHREHVLELRVRGHRHAEPRRARAARAVPQGPAAGSVRPRVGAAQARRVPDGVCLLPRARGCRKRADDTIAPR